MGKLLSKLKSQRGATGTDILISASIIVLSIGIVSMMYVNTSIQSRNITRTAGANRIATNLIENIDAMSYDEFVAGMKSITSKTNWYEATNKNNISNTTLFDSTNYTTKIPNGFRVDITATPVYGSHTNNAEKFDLVRRIEIKVKYNVGNSEQNVTFNTVKKRELIKECNEPALGILSTQIKSGAKIYPVKYLSSAKAYIRTTEDDPEWYSYSTKNWATVIVSRVAESSLFDVNGKFIGTINVADNSSYTQKYVWVPAYYTTTTSSKVFTSFAYRVPSATKIVEKNLTAISGGGTFKYYAPDPKAGTDLVDTVWGATTGLWSGVNADNTFASDYAKGLNSNATYGPCNIH